VTVRDLESTNSDTSAGGVLITSVIPNSPAATAGVQVSDVIVEFDGELVRSARQFARLVQDTPPGSRVRASVLRSGKRRDVTMTPADSAGLSRLGRADDLRRFDGPKPQLRWQGAYRLGVVLHELMPGMARVFGATRGVMVAAVVDGSAAAWAGLQVADVILAAADQRVRSHADLNVAMRTAAGSIDLFIVRDKTALTITVSLAAPETAGADWVI
jgi:serine protease Do